MDMIESYLPSNIIFDIHRFIFQRRTTKSETCNPIPFARSLNKFDTELKHCGSFLYERYYSYEKRQVPGHIVYICLLSSMWNRIYDSLGTQLIFNEGQRETLVGANSGTTPKYRYCTYMHKAECRVGSKAGKVLKS